MTGINWTDVTWNPVRGCSRVSEGCLHCYAERVAGRFSGPGQPYEGLVKVVSKVRRNDRADGSIVLTKVDESRWTGVVRMVPEKLADPLRWKKPRRVFVNSMSDLFHESLSNEQIAAVFGVMAAAPRHTFQVLTKRARRMREWFEWVQQEQECPLSTCGREMVCHLGSLEAGDPAARATVGHSWPLPNVWLGVSVENQPAHDERAEQLLACPAAVYFFSIEPMLGPVDVAQSLRRMLRTDDGRLLRNDHPDAPSTPGTWRRHVDWVIAGCESGPGARPCEVDWLRSLRDQCAEAKVPFWLKQAVQSPRCDVISTTLDDGSREHEIRHTIGFGEGSKRKPGGIIDLPYLYGVQHAEMPKGGV